MDEDTPTDRAKSEIQDDQDAEQPADEKSEVGGTEPLLQCRALQWNVHLNTTVTMVYIITILEYDRYDDLPL
jgi:hypothetical protein